jgi:hypothetical protein
MKQIKDSLPTKRKCAFSMMNKKGSWKYVIGIFLAIASILIVFVVVMSYDSPLTLNIKAVACHGNAGVRSMVPFKNWISPLMFCKTYETPVKIDATKFSNCPTVDFTHMNSYNREEYYRQCARMQINELADICWRMGGKGHYSLTPIHKSIQWGAEKFVVDTANDPLMIVAFGAGGFLGGGYGAGAAALSLNYIRDESGNSDWGKQDFFEAPKTSGVLRCFRYQVVKPRNLDFTDTSFGFTNYRYNDTLGVNSSEAGRMMAAIRPDPDNDNRTELNLKYSASLNYDYKAGDICYISMYVDGKTMSRDCDKWTRGLDRYDILN